MNEKEMLELLSDKHIRFRKYLIPIRKQKSLD